jgi:hypothetical protein
VIFRIEIFIAVVCAISISMLLISPSERESFLPLRSLIRRIFPKQNFMERHRRLNLICLVMLGTFATAGVVVFLITQLGNRVQ